ncbi:dioxygenase [Methylicorpusculum oleiharenae]|uniref:DODA-type extradiol aromatic ring-opening family dioxygenase n=1 Tax=Methylicorpusculum oleiharenae TaxID=1338687 RepID=UPI00135AF276|nr:class III extradiol ring-cleavage dioxygenase [Methylicorpusculum oleiharenae]MCD2452551.1 dioxygenase [Methylicorpusculum oleiharenae]
MENKYKALFLSHGGGPMPLLGDAGHQEMVACLENIASIIPKPDALVVVSAHWEERLPTITSGTTPSLIYDYSGFPEESYGIRYPCVGEPSLARQIQELLSDAEILSELDGERGFDHGFFVPLKIMYPEANIPCVQLSLVSTLDPSEHIEVGRALRSLSLGNVLVIGSGFSFHNMKAFFRPDTPKSLELNHLFEEWLLKTCCNSDYSEDERRQLLIRWTDAPGARFCHPREEHLLPLHVCYGVAQAPCPEYFEVKIMNKKSSMYLW